MRVFMAELVPAIYVFLFESKKGVDARPKAGHDELSYPTSPEPSTTTLAPTGTRW
jgi:hypothetical protein